ncbi:hypothetical protein AVEN_164376-1 [Araneus ventricosus]|uniref:Uncharacterized protein n=1 Tax=Araneus ventricosus TaxID=182803 RepID=A0A4Y2GEZ9_ARAVE|nr:hypothetical protein AVEN_164376-1 [Araneus ventricosus]
MTGDFLVINKSRGPVTICEARRRFQNISAAEKYSQAVKINRHVTETIIDINEEFEQAPNLTLRTEQQASMLMDAFQSEAINLSKAIETVLCKFSDNLDLKFLGKESSPPEIKVPRNKNDDGEIPMSSDLLILQDSSNALKKGSYKYKV